MKKLGKKSTQLLDYLTNLTIDVDIGIQRHQLKIEKVHTNDNQSNIREKHKLSSISP